MANLVIVESPAKANTIKGYLGSGYKVISSKGHIRDLPKSTLGIDVEGGFLPHYINIRGKGDVIKELKQEAKSANKIFLATDPDREGEAISWHIAQELGISIDTPCRVTFNEVTKTAVKEAIKNPRVINEDLVNSQQARRILDRLVGFNLSQLLWKNLKSGLSGGRVQSVAARIITEREKEIREFTPTEYWTVDALLENGGENVSVRLHANKHGKIKISSEEEAANIKNKIKDEPFSVVSVKHSKKNKLPAPPFTTSSLLQEASKKLGFQSQKIMRIAQELYDGLNLGSELGGVQGLITYMRTDSTRVSIGAQTSAIEYIKKNFGDEYAPKNARFYKSDSNSQDAHEAIRPSNVNIIPSAIRRMLTQDQYKLYKLIWERFIASQMASCVLDTVTVKLENSGYVFRTGGYIVDFKGYTVIYGAEEDVGDADEYSVSLSKLPNLSEGERIYAKDIKAEQHFTEPPPRYTEASLIEFLKENGIGRPSTYATIISIILNREYVRREGKSLAATPLGEVTTKFIREHFPEITDYEFTASLETKLDSIENKENTMHGVISDFYAKFQKELEAAERSGKSNVSIPLEESDVICDKCGAKMVYKSGRFGRFLACPSYPECKNTKALNKDGSVAEPKKKTEEIADFKCELCGADVVIRQGRYGSFYACTNYPVCKFTKQKVTDTGAKCPKCSSRILARHGKSNSLFYSCERYPECDFSTWDMPLSESCPDCGEMLYYKKLRRTVFCKNKNCSYKRTEEKTVIE